MTGYPDITPKIHTSIGSKQFYYIKISIFAKIKYSLVYALVYEASTLNNHHQSNKHPIITVKEGLDDISDDENPWRTLQKVVKER